MTSPLGRSVPRSQIQLYIDELLGTTLQVWLLRLVIVASAAVAIVAEAAASGPLWGAGLGAVIVLAAASSLRPDSPLPLLVMVIVVWRWSVADQATSPWLAVAALCLLVFHTACVLGATIPIGGSLPTSTLVRSAVQTGIVGGFTLAVWGFVVAFEPGSNGNGLATGVGLVIVSAAALVILNRSTQN